MKAATLLAPAFFFPLASHADPCPCTLHQAEAHASGHCNRSENRAKCLLVFEIASEEHERLISSLLGEVGVEEPRPQEVLQIIASNDPATFDDDFLRDALPTMVAVSMTPDPAWSSQPLDEWYSHLSEVIEFTNDNLDEITSIFTDRNYMRTAQDLGAAMISFGCIEYTFEALSLFRSPFSGATGRCDEFGG